MLSPAKLIQKENSLIYALPRLSGYRGLLAALLLLTMLLFTLVKSSMVTAGLGIEEPSWSRNLPADICYGTNHTGCHVGSPVTALIDADNKKDIIAVTNNGHVVAVRHDGQLLWDTDIAPFFGMAPGTHEIHSSPAVADIDNDGYPEIAVGAGTLDRNICTQGGLIVLDHLGHVEAGWPYLTFDEDIPPAGCRESIVSSPAVGDMDNDGDLEIVAASFDKRIYAWHHDGTLVAGYPPESAHRARFPTWEGFIGKLGDNTWGSPGMADLDNDGYLDVIIGTAEGNYDARWGGDSGGWTCPYTLPPGWSPGYCGGSIYAFDHLGGLKPGFPVYVLEAISSSPAISDITGDGKYEIFIGTGDFYHRESPDHPSDGFRLFGIDNQGNDLPGWEGGNVTGGSVLLSPSIGDIAGDPTPEIVVYAADNRVYAWNIDGSLVNGFPMTPLDHMGDDYVHNWIRGQSLADYDGDGKMEIIFAQGWSITVIDGNGSQLTATNFPNNSLPIYNAMGLVANTPAVDDIDGDGELELIVTNSRMYVWDLEQASAAVDWPVFKGNRARTGVLLQPKMNAAPDIITLLHQSGDPSDASTVLAIKNSGSRSFEWSSTYPSDVTLAPSSGVIDEFGVTYITITVDIQGRTDGVHTLGNIAINATMEAGIVINGNLSFPIRLIVGEISRLYTPYIGK